MSDHKEKIGELIKAVPLMLSREYKHRLIGEYWELKVRCSKLEDSLKEYDEGQTVFPSSFNPELLREQLVYMKNYLTVLEERAELEDIDLSDIDVSDEEFCIVLFGDEEMHGSYRTGSSHDFVKALMRDLADVCVKYRKSDDADLAEFCKGMGDTIMLLMLKNLAEKDESEE